MSGGVVPPNRPAVAGALIHRVPRMVRAVVDGLEGSGARVAVLHPTDGFGPDHDIDIAVDRPIRSVRPTIVRAMEAEGFTFVTSIEYDVGGAETIVFARVADTHLEAVGIDVAHDPRGIGRYGVAMAVLLDDTTRELGTPSPGSAWEAVYLLSKRVRKGGWDRLEILHRLVGEERGRFEEAARIVVGGRWAARLTARLEDGSTLVRSPAEASRIRRAISSRRILREPWGPVRRVARTVRRLRTPTGLYVTISGVDGAGKSTLAADLVERAGPLFRRCLRLHWRPALLPRLGSLAARPRPDPERPHGSNPSGTLASSLRLLYYWIDHVLGYWARIWPARIRSGLVVMERGFLDMSVDPRRYRMAGPWRLVDVLARAVPGPDLHVVLVAHPEVLHHRKPEVPMEEMRRQTAEWERIARSSARARILDAGRPLDEVRTEALRALIQCRSHP